MSRRKHRKSMADRAVTRRYVARVVGRARQDILDAIVMSERLARIVDNVEPVPAERMASVLDWTYTDARGWNGRTG